jgi:23S rRNA maturation-related 3'-5' exoribonuclease YhaM
MRLSLDMITKSRCTTENMPKIKAYLADLYATITGHDYKVLTVFTTAQHSCHSYLTLSRNIHAALIHHPCSVKSVEK